MSRSGRISLIVVAVIAAIVVFLLVKPADEAQTPTPTDPVVTPDPDGGDPDREPKPPRPEPVVTRIEIVGGEPKGGATKIEVDRGDRVEFQVVSDIAEHVHVHGYDLFADVGPGQKAKFSFKADSDGVYEIELEGSATLIAELRVNP